MTNEIEMFALEKVNEIGIVPFLNKLGWEVSCSAYMTEPDGEFVYVYDDYANENEMGLVPMAKFRLSLKNKPTDILVMQAALTSEALKVSGLTYTLRESARDKEDTDAIHIHIVENDAYASALNRAAKVAKVAKYGSLSCSECKHQFDDWTIHHADGGRRKRAVVRHPTKRGTYRILPCGSCPVQFREEFESRMAKDNAMREEIQIKSPDAFRE
jgi:hypothetical protein